MSNDVLNFEQENSQNIISKIIFNKSFIISLLKLNILFLFTFILFRHECYKNINFNLINKNITNYKNSSSSTNTIHLSMAFEYSYFSPTLISITSVLINAKKDTNINYHLLIDNTINEGHKNMIKSLVKFHRLTKFSFYNIGEIYEKFTVGKNYSILPNYYRLFLHFFLQNINRTIYLDADTLIYSDLSDMYCLNMSGLYFRGILDPIKMFEGFNSIKTDHYINTGVLLMNVQKYRDDAIFNKMIEYSKIHALIEDYQELVNAVCFFGIDLLPPKYGIQFLDQELINILSNKSHKIFYDKNELIEANSHVSIRHYYNCKPWQIGNSSYLYNEFIYYANISNFYRYICRNLEKLC